METQLISNTDKTLAHLLAEELPKADALTVCVAFLKQSGLSVLLPGLKTMLQCGGSATVIAGLDFYLTEPQALNRLYRLVQPNAALTCRVFDSAGNATFHPKLYAIAKGSQVAMVIGSANLTSGGLHANIEACALVRTTIANPLYADFLENVAAIAGDSRCVTLDPTVLSRYTRKFDIYHKHFRQFQRISHAALDEIFTVSEHKLRQYVGEYLASLKQQSEWSRRCDDYLSARDILDGMLAKTFSSSAQFLAEYEKLVGKKGAGRRWHSGSLFRAKATVAEGYGVFIEMLADIKAHIGIPPADLLALGKTYTDQVKGLSFNVLTEIMNTYSPDTYAVLNANPVDSLAEIGMQNFQTPGAFKPETYAEFVALLKKLQEFLGLENLSHVDHFLNYVYWKYVKGIDYD